VVRGELFFCLERGMREGLAGRFITTDEFHGKYFLRMQVV
jgi:hypothetical protein